MSDSPIPFADGDDPEDAYDASDTIAEQLANLDRRLLFIVLRPGISSSERGARLQRVREDLQRIAERIRTALDALG